MVKVVVYRLNKIFHMPCLQALRKRCPCPVGSGSLDEKTKLTQWKQVKLTVVTISSHMLRLTQTSISSSLLLVQPSTVCASFPPILWKATSSNMYVLSCQFSLKAFLQSNRKFRASPSSSPIGRCLHHFFLHLLLCFVFVIFFWPKSCSIPGFFPPRSSLHLHYLCPCSMSLYYNLCLFYHSQWLHLLLPPGVLLSFNFDTCLHYLTERNSRGLERTAGNGLYSFPEVVTIEQCKFYRGKNCQILNEHSCEALWYSLVRRKPLLGIDQEWEKLSWPWGPKLSS